MYTTASGVPIPQGTDSFSPPTQFKNWADKADTYHWDVTVATDSERNALAAPVRRNGLRCYVTGTGILWVYNNGWSPLVGVSHLQLDTTNSQPKLTTQHGIGRVASVAAAQVTKTVTFPVAFTSTPVIHVDYIGGRSGAVAPFNPASLIDVAPPLVGKGFGPSTTGLTVLMHRTDGANLPPDWSLYYSWSATGTVA
ncbi:hypothetical protein [Cryobacterium sp. BB736]|uniref:hypothetical protein n=1 Tax=Cryobacterium sp. BB736 TaxID=2746963 RepID=UPI001875A39C|nr:hypothetical protein [Cryobacterium sp. BB736]